MNLIEIPVEEAVHLGAVDGALYSQYFFPRAVRQNVPQFHREMWADLDDPAARFVAWKVFRDGAKTTLLRLAASRRIAYGVSRTVVYTSNSEGHAVRSVRWLQKQVEHNSLWAETFQLRKGGKWSGPEIEIIHGVEEVPITVFAVGITGQIRGINFDDFRPDFIVADDVDNEETTGTKEQRKKSSDLFFGALANSLAPSSDTPLAKMALAQTPLADGDIIDQAAKDPTWRTKTFSILTESNRSRWESRHPTTEVLLQKQAFIARRQLPLWMREKECQIVSSELASFSGDWLQRYTVLPGGLWYVLAIDPAFSDSKDADDYAMVVWGCQGRKRYLAEYFLSKGVEPDAAVSIFLEYLLRYRPRGLRKIVYEKVAGQKTLGWLLKEAMRRQRMFTPIYEHDDKRRKADVILQTYLAYGPYGEIYVRDDQVDFIQAFSTWHPSWTGKDDLLDAGARGLAATTTGGTVEDVESSEDDSYKPLPEWRASP